MGHVQASEGSLIVSALRGEAALLRRGAGGAGVVVIGMGASALGAAERFAGLRLVVVAGFGGGLAPELRCGDVVVDGPPMGFVSGKGCVVGRIHTAGGIVSTASEKRELHARTGALAVDMELAVVREALAGSGALVVGVRAVLDPASRTLPTWLGSVVGSTGEARMGAMAGAMARDPRRVSDLAGVWIASRRAGRGLVGVVRRLVCGRWADG